MTRRHRLRRFFLALVALMAVGCATLGVLVGLGTVRPTVVKPSWWPSTTTSSRASSDPGASVIGPIDPAKAGHIADAPARHRTKLYPTQFAAFSNPKSLIGTKWANIVVFPDRIETRLGARIIWIGYFRQVPNFDGSISLDDISALLAKSPTPDWLRETDPGVFLQKVGVVEAPGTVLTVATPRVKELRMVVAPYVYVSAWNATAQFRGVKVTSWMPAANAPDTDPNHDRPFISVKGPGSRLDVTDSEICYLGTDTSQGYGISWGAQTTGQALRSVFHDNLFGAYTSLAVGVTFQNNVFRNNARYGLDPHTNSRNLVITNNEAYGNNTHGIIFSKSVVNSVVANNHSHDNGANGIMMDELSNNNVIQNNVAEHNAGAGIVLQGSSNNQVTGNVVANNPIGIRVNTNELGVAVDNHIAGNQLATNHTGIKVYHGTRNTTLANNTIRDTQDTALSLQDPTISQSDSVINAYRAAVISGGTSTLHALSAQQVVRGVIVGSGATAAIDSANIAAAKVGIAMHDNATLALSGALTTIDGARKGVIVNGAANLNNLTLHNVIKGVVLAPSARVSIDGSQLVAEQVGLEVQGLGGGSRITMHNSTIKAPNPVAGATLTEDSGNRIIMVLSWLAIAGAVFVTLALALYLIHRIWSPSSGARHPSRPPGDRRAEDEQEPVPTGQPV